MNIQKIIAIALFSASSYAASAQVTEATTTTTATTVQDANKSNAIKTNKTRIKNGVKSGELTNAEAARLALQNRELKNDKKEIKADGIVTTEERAAYRQDKKQVSKRIYRQKHDKQTRN